MSVSKGIWLILVAVGLLSLGAIRKNEDPILRTQTDPISYKQKQEETKDGVKGAPSPSFTYYSRNEFLTSSPMATSAEEAENAEKDLDSPEDWISEEGEFEEQTASEGSDDEWWTEEEAGGFEPEES